MKLFSVYGSEFSGEIQSINQTFISCIVLSITFYMEGVGEFLALSTQHKLKMK